MLDNVDHGDDIEKLFRLAVLEDSMMHRQTAAPGHAGADERHAFGILKRAVAEARPPAPEIVAHVLLAALIEVAMLVARSDRPKAALRDGTRTVDALLDALLRGGPEKMPGADGH